MALPQVTVSVSGDATLGGTTTVQAVNGVVTFTDLTLVGAVGTNYTLTFATTTGLASATATVSPSGAGAAASLVISGTGTQAAGASQDLTITAKDSYGNTATGYTGDKSLTFSGASTAAAGQIPSVKDKTGTTVAFGTAATITFSAGVASVSAGANGVMTLYAAETAAVSVTDGSITATAPLSVTVSHAAAAGSQSELSVSASSVAAGGSVTLLVTAKDQYGNAVTAGGATVVFTRDSGAGTLGSVVDNGNGTYQATVTAPTVLSTTSGVFSATINSSSVEGGTGLAQSETVTYVPGLAAVLILTGTGTQTAGGSQDLTITAEDSYGNTATSYTGDKSLTFSGASTAPDSTSVPTVTDKTGSAVDFGTATTITFSAGVASVSSGSNGAMVLYAAETAAVSVTDGSVSSASPLAVLVSADSASQLAVAIAPVAGQSGASMSTQPVAQVQDQYGNVVTSDSSTAVEVSASAGTLGGTTTVTASAGVATFTDLTFTGTVGTSYTLTFAEDPSAGLTDATATISPVAAPVPVPSGGGGSAPSSDIDWARIPRSPALGPVLDSPFGAVTDNDVVVDGVQWTRNADDSGWEAKGSGFVVGMSAVAPNGDPEDLAGNGTLRLPEGGRLVLSGTGYLPGTEVHAFLLPRNRLLGSPRSWLFRAAAVEATAGAIYVASTQADARGAVDAEMPVPADAQLGDYVLQVNGLVAPDDVRSVLLNTDVVTWKANTPAAQLQTSALFGSGSSEVSRTGKAKMAAFASQLPRTGTVTAVNIVAMSTGRPTTNANLRFAEQRANALVDELRGLGWTGATSTVLLVRDPETRDVRAWQPSSSRTGMGSWIPLSDVAQNAAKAGSGRYLSTLTYRTGS